MYFFCSNPWMERKINVTSQSQETTRQEWKESRGRLDHNPNPRATAAIV
jgi:hypothetical protein